MARRIFQRIQLTYRLVRKLGHLLEALVEEIGEELVPSGSVEIPLGSAQFELTGLTPIPSAEIPLRLAVPMATGADHGVMLTPELVAALHSVLQ